MAVAATIPWNEILKAAPLIVSGAKKIWEQFASKPKKPPVDPEADLRTQFTALSNRVQENEAAQGEQAKVVALMAEQLLAIARRSARGYWFGVTGIVLGCISLALALLHW